MEPGIWLGKCPSFGTGYLAREVSQLWNRVFGSGGVPGLGPVPSLEPGNWLGRCPRNGVSVRRGVGWGSCIAMAADSVQRCVGWGSCIAMAADSVRRCVGWGSCIAWERIRYSVVWGGVRVLHGSGLGTAWGGLGFVYCMHGSGFGTALCGVGSCIAMAEDSVRRAALCGVGFVCCMGADSVQRCVGWGSCIARDSGQCWVRVLRGIRDHVHLGVLRGIRDHVRLGVLYGIRDGVGL